MTAVITGAGSGVGQATALAMAGLGWDVAIIGRRQETLDETLKIAGDVASRLIPYVCDIADPDTVASTGRTILQKFRNVDVLVNAAGTNAPNRSLEVLNMEDYRRMMDTNLNGAYYCVQAFLPAMRKRGSGTIINIISDAAKQASPRPVRRIPCRRLASLASPRQSMPKSAPAAFAPAPSFPAISTRRSSTNARSFPMRKHALA